jgi:hypothetical protein
VVEQRRRAEVAEQERLGLLPDVRLGYRRVLEGVRRDLADWAEVEVLADVLERPARELDAVAVVRPVVREDVVLAARVPPLAPQKVLYLLLGKEITKTY